MITEKDDLIQVIQKGAVVITPNNRLSLMLLKDTLQQSHQSCIDKPRCLPYSAFLRDLFQRLVHKTPHIDHPILINPQHSEYLFRHVINATHRWPCNEGLLQSIIKAWTTCKQWDVPDDHKAFNERPQTHQFQQWFQSFEHELKNRQLITEHHLVNYLTQHTLEPIQTLIWACFDDYSPSQLKLQESFLQKGTHQIHYDIPHQHNACYQHQAQDENDEYEQLIAWIKTKRNAGCNTIGIVLPDLSQNITRIIRRFNAHFPDDDVNVSLGTSLADYPLMAHALQWISLDEKVLTHHQARLLLHSPYLAHAEHEQLLRTELFGKNIHLQEAHIPHDAFLKVIAAELPLLTTALKTMRSYPSKASPHEWSQLLKERLIGLGFPGELSLNSLNYQCFQRINALFDELREFTLISPCLTQKEALQLFSSLAKKAIFQPQKKHAPIQLLGLLEASGCTFDCIWMLGMTDQCLPQKPRLSAFIPIELQRTLDMPHATPERELRHATQLIKRLKHSSETVIFSFPRLLGELPNLPSPLINTLPNFTPTLQPVTQSNQTALIPALESFIFPMQANELRKGGSSLLANQAKCPFRAFAIHRLHLKQEPTATVGPSALERGILIHSILESLWKQLKSHHDLCMQSSDTLEGLIDKAIDNALQPLHNLKPLSFAPLIQSVEFKRLKRLVHAALDWERNRSPFVVEALEQAFSLTLAGIEFNLQVDRLDKLPSGEKWIIDYKSRLPAPPPWLEERPESPQLLLYALMDEAIRGLIFVELKQGQITASGLAEEPVPIQGIRGLNPSTSWATEQSKWYSQLTTLATEFNHGHCPPTPTHTKTCLTCDIKALCRKESNIQYAQDEIG